MTYAARPPSAAGRGNRLLRCVLLLALVGSGCQTPLADLKPGERPPPGSVEAGLWMQMDKVEAKLESSGRIVRDRELNDYVKAILCRLSPEYCESIRVYLVETPYFNATMRPNGTMELWTGLMLRAQNEAQLAFVLAHELAHYTRRHTLKRWQDVKFKSNGVLFVQVLSAAAGVGYVGNLAALAASASIFAFSRAQESEADAIALEMIRNAGYDTREPSKLWTSLVDELEYAEEDSGTFIFFATHPRADDRADVLLELAANDEPAARERDRFLSVLQPHRATMLRSELRARRFDRSEWLFGRLLEAGVATGEVEFYRGELYRTRGEEGDEALALQAYGEALRSEDCPPDAYRAIGLIYRSRAEHGRAREFFERYLELVPDAVDRKMIESYLEPGEPSS